jgi:hypothetical protein
VWAGHGRTHQVRVSAGAAARAATWPDEVLVLAEGVGFEPTRSKLLAVFKTAAIGH